MKKLLNKLISFSLIIMLAISSLSVNIVFATNEKVKNAYDFNNADTALENVSGKNLKINENIVEKDGAVLAKYWAPFCRVDIANLFDNMTLMNNATFRIKLDVKVDSYSPTSNSSIYAVVADENGEMIYNYKDYSNTGVNIAKTAYQTITMDYKYSNLTNEPKYVCLLLANAADENNQVYVLIDNVSVEQLELGSDDSSEYEANYDAGYSFENESSMPDYVKSRVLTSGRTFHFDSSIGHSPDNKGKSIRTEFWANYAALSILNLFSKAGAVPGDKYKIAAYIKVHNTSAYDEGELYLRVSDDKALTATNGSQVMSDSGKVVEVNKEGWSLLELEFEVPSDREPYAVEIACKTTASSDKRLIVNIDDVSITNVANIESKGMSISDQDLELVNELGIMPSIFAESFEESKLVTRGDFARFMMTLYGGEEKGTVEYPFFDVTADDACAQAVAFLKNANLMSGYSNGTFRPNDYITFGEAVKVIVSYLGYDFYAQNKGGYPLGYLITAQRTHITDNLFKDEYSSVSYKDLLTIYVNLLNTSITEQTTFGEQITFDNEDKTVLENVFGIKKDEGILNGTDATYLTGESNLSSKMISIANEIFVCDNQETVSKVKKLLGYSVEYYYKETVGNNYNNLIFAQETEGLNNTFVIYAKNDPVYSNGYIYYTDSSNREKKVKVGFAANVIYNGKCYQGTDNVFSINDGNITLIDADLDSSYETVIVNDIHYYVVDNIDQIREVIYTRFTNDEIIASDKQTDAIVNIYNSRGSKVSLKNIAIGSVIEVKQSKDGGVKIVDIVVSSKFITGNIAEISNIDQANGFVKVGRNSYGVTKTYKSLEEENLCDEIVAGSEMSLYINSNSEIVAAEKSYSDKYAYIIEGYREQKADLEISAKIITAGDDILNLYFADEVTLNGTKYDIDDSALNVLFSGNDLKRQLIGYKTNADGKIDTIKTVNPSTRPIEGEICQIVDGDSEVYRNAYFGKGKYNLKYNTAIFRIPATESKGEEYFSSISTKDLSSGSTYVIYGYSTNGVYNNLDIMVLKDDYGLRDAKRLASNTKVFLINKVGKTINVDGDECILLTGIIGGEEKSVKIIDERTNKTPEFESGDIVMYEANDNNEVVITNNGTGKRDCSFAYVLDADGNSGNPESVVEFTVNTADSYTHLFRPVMIKDNYIWGNEINTIDAYNEDIDGELIPESSFNTATMTLYVYDDSKKTFTEIGPGSINLVDLSTKEGAYMFVHSCSKKPEVMVIYQ